jgi:L,D-transpeptidase ErfK/SrfK
MRLYYFTSSDKVYTFPIGMGVLDFKTPAGNFKVVNKKVNPTWHIPKSLQAKYGMAEMPPGPDNPLGAYAMRLSNPSYLIHGTNQPYGVGLRVSHGCVRLYPEDIARLFPMVPMGTPVRIINEPYVAGWRDGQLYLEAHQPLAEDAERWNGSLKPMEQAVASRAAGQSVEVSWDRARAVAREARGLPLPIGPGSPELDELLAKAPQVPSVPPWAVPVDEGEEAVQGASSPDELADNQSSLPPS